MTYAIWLAPLGLAMGVAGLIAFLWSVKAGQFDDPDGAAERVLLNDAAISPLAAGDNKGSNTAANPDRLPMSRHDA